MDAMRRAVKEMDCEVLTGPVRYMYPDTIPVWLNKQVMRQGRDMNNRPRGAIQKMTGTGNSMLQAGWYARHHEKLQFDSRFRFSGGSDTDFFHTLKDLGGCIKWVDDAIVRETVPICLLYTSPSPRDS